ncbi:aminodeoxychorismate synthase component I [Chungangia koreensis]|uniref:Aminodeoxychorismate synthase component I n=1 Tax=Chungangia koreensis TaxID=752657 RepID=A0ABV8X2E2_9LACT
MSNTFTCSFEYVNHDGQLVPMTFTNPITIIQAIRIEEVIPALREIETAVEKGYYAAGFLSYESAPAFESAFKVHESPTMPLLWFGIFEEPEYRKLERARHYTLSEWTPNVSHEEYAASIQAIRDAIELGITYQTNYTIRLTADFEGDDLSLFTKMKRAQASNYCSYVNTGEHSILSASPELFFHLKGNHIKTKPMKGTLKRGLYYEEDEANREWLNHSEKNRSENVMIVDLLRNDLGMIAEAGSVKVTELFKIEKYPTVLQMTSTIEAEISSDKTIVDIFKALFPCGSITGAPKISTMDVIAGLETAPREVYCGTIGFITPEKEAVFNVPIRTMMIVQKTGKATYGVGGGITWDSTAEDEYEEVLAKASFLKTERPDFEILESILLEDGAYFLLTEHLQRMKKSAHYFNFEFPHKKIMETLDECSSNHPVGSFKVRLLLNKSGDVEIEAQQITQIETPILIGLAEKPVNRQNPFLYNKTTNRKIYSELKLQKQDVFDTLLWNKNHELTEFCNGNIVLEIDGDLFTPPVRSGLLPGTFRNSLLNDEVIKEKVLSISDLNRSTKIWFINSVRRWLEVKLKK